MHMYTTKTSPFLLASEEKYCPQSPQSLNQKHSLCVYHNEEARNMYRRNIRMGRRGRGLPDAARAFEDQDTYQLYFLNNGPDAAAVTGIQCKQGNGISRMAGRASVLLT